jgi:hypothetical protein
MSAVRTMEVTKKAELVLHEAIHEAVCLKDKSDLLGSVHGSPPQRDARKQLYCVALHDTL